MLNIGGSSRNAYWNNDEWIIPPYKSKEFMKYLKRNNITLEDFRKLPIYQFAVEHGRIVDDEWAEI